jgi:hypothetical protein
MECAHEKRVEVKLPPQLDSLRSQAPPGNEIVFQQNYFAAFNAAWAAANRAIGTRYGLQLT